MGGTWYWNRYPGARFDSEAYIYQYLFSEDLYKDWSWSEKFPGQPEIEQWMHYVTDRLDLRRDIQFSTTITSAHFDEDRGRWTIPTDRGDVDRHPVLRHLRRDALRADGEPLRGPGQLPRADLPHLADGRGEDVDLAGKRVGVVGVGATGIQVIQTIADEVGHLTVFARTPQYVLPMKNPRYGRRSRPRTRRASTS